MISCATEVYIFELEQICPETGEWTEVKLDLEVVTQDGRYLLDVSVFHAFQKGAKGKERYVKLREREKRKYERYPMHKDGQRVTDAALVPIILNTFGGVGEKATEFLYAVAGSEAKRIIEEISMLAVLLSAEMILQSHAPSNLSNLVSLPNSSAPAADPGAQPDVGEGEKETERDEAGFLRPELRGETEGSRVECLACSSSAGKKVFTTGKFRSSDGRHAVSCSVKASTGQLYPLERSLAFIHKPTLIIKFEDISAVEFERFTGYGQSSATKNFDLKISTRGLSRRPL